MKTPALLLVCIPLLVSIATAQQFKVIHSFKGFPTDAAYTTSTLVFDQAGNLYGASAGGGNSTACFGNTGCGTVFELSPKGDGTWTETVLYNFCSKIQGMLCLDGEAPHAGVVLDSEGNIYGTTVAGGSVSCIFFPGGGCGTVFKLSPPAAPGGAWTETILYTFCLNPVKGLCLDGSAPGSPLTMDNSGNLYGTTAGGGSGHFVEQGEQGGGVVFELSVGLNGWSETVLYNFCSQGTGASCPDGFTPTAGVNFDPAGNLFGTTDYSGTTPGTGGTVYELSPSVSGWQYRRLLGIPPGSRSNTLLGGISFDTAGNLYSTFGAPDGGVFRLSPNGGQLRVFSFNGTDGQDPLSGVYVSNNGDIYGTTSGGSGAGNIFQISTTGKEAVLHTFCSWPNCNDGSGSWSTPVPDSSGNLYGTTENGGTYGAGVVFEITP